MNIKYLYLFLFFVQPMIEKLYVNTNSYLKEINKSFIEQNCLTQFNADKDLGQHWVR